MTVVEHIEHKVDVAILVDEVVPGFGEFGVLAFTTTRERGTFALQSAAPASEIFGRWMALAEQLAPRAGRLASAHQVHGDRILVHQGAWSGWLRASAADGHVAISPGTAMAVTVADCVPVFIAHPGGATAIVHSGWKGTLANVTGRAVERLVASGLSARDLLVHCGPSICGRCYEVSPDVYGRLTGRVVPTPTSVDLRGRIADDARAMGVEQISISQWCTRCHNDRFYSHRCGDEGRQLGVIAGPFAG